MTDPFSHDDDFPLSFWEFSDPPLEWDAVGEARLERLVHVTERRNQALAQTQRSLNPQTEFFTYEPN